MKNATVMHRAFAAAKRMSFSDDTENRYLYLEGIDGQCTERHHRNWLAVTEEHLDENGNLVFTRKGNGDVPKLELFCMFDQMISAMRLHICRHGEVIRQMKMENIRIKSVYTYVGADGTTLQTVTLAQAARA